MLFPIVHRQKQIDEYSVCYFFLLAKMNNIKKHYFNEQTNSKGLYSCSFSSVSRLLYSLEKKCLICEAL